MRICECFLTTLALACGGAFCQTGAPAHPGDCARAAERLGSERMREKAWGAYLAATCYLPGLSAEIAAELDVEHADFAWDSEPFWVQRALLDALIQLRQPLDSSLLASFVRAFRTEAAILMLQHPFANRESLAALRAGEPRGFEWVAASNALSAMRAPGFAAALLHEVRFTQSVWVRDSGEPPGRGEAGSLLGGNTTVRVPPGFPPVGLYRLTGQGLPGDELIADGPTPMYSHRTLVEPGKEVIWDQPPEGYCFDCMRIEYLAELARVPVAEAWRAIEADTTVHWTNLAALAAEISRALEAQRAALHRLASAAGVTDSEGMFLQITVSVVDERSDRAVPLPTILPLGLRLP